jgi:hypothetical protein
MAPLSADEAWVVHFTCEDDYRPIWQFDEGLRRGVDVVYFVEFTALVMRAHWKDDVGNNRQVNNRALTVCSSFNCIYYSSFWLNPAIVLSYVWFKFHLSNVCTVAQ